MTDEDKAELEALLSKLQKLKPAPKHLKVLCTDSETRKIMVPATRQKWQKLRTVISGLDWLRVEAYNARGEFQDGFESEGATEEYEDPEGNNTARDIAFYNAVARQVRLNSESVRDALAANEKQTKSVMDAAAKCIEMTTMAAAALRQTYETRLGVLDAMLDEQGAEGQGLLSGKFLDHMGAEIAKVAAPEILKKVQGGNSKGRRAS